jgi:ankyrin repeat protein
MQIHSAARRGEIDAIRYCIERDVPVDQTTEYNDTPLITVISSLGGRRRLAPAVVFETVQFLFGAGADVHAKKGGGDTALRVAIERRCVPVVRLLCERGGASDFQAVERDDLLLRVAVGEDAETREIRELLLLHGVQIKLPNPANLPTVTEVLSGLPYFPELSELMDYPSRSLMRREDSLLDRLVLGSAQDLRGAAISQEELKKTVSSWKLTPFLIAAALGDVEKAGILLERGSSLHECDDVGRSVLDVAATFGRVEMVTFLIDRGLHPDFTNGCRDTPLHTACAYDHAHCVTTLLERGASAGWHNGFGRPIHSAASLPVTRVLVEKGGANINEVDTCGEWPLKNAATESDFAWTKWLLEHGAEVDLTSTGETALHSAVRMDAREVAQLLMEHGANPNAQDVDGWTPLFSVCSREMVELLRQFGGDSNISDQCGGRPKKWVEDPLIQELL